MERLVSIMPRVLRFLAPQGGWGKHGFFREGGRGTTKKTTENPGVSAWPEGEREGMANRLHNLG